MFSLLQDMPITKTTKSLTVSFSYSKLEDKYRLRSSPSSELVSCPRFRAKIAPDQNANAEDELKRSIW